MVATGLAFQSCTSKKESTSAEAVDVSVPEEMANTLADAEKDEGWQLLFDGKTLDGWKRFNRDTIGPLWSVQDGAILCNGEGLGEGSGKMGGSLVTTQTFGNFELVFDFKLSPGGN